VSLNNRLAFLVNFEIADAIIDVARSAGWELPQATRRVYATDTYRKWADVSTDYCKYAYPIKLMALCEDLNIPNVYDLYDE
jgi:hypothetical protein